MTDQRKSGWYWVRTGGKHVWSVAHYSAAHKLWTMEGHELSEKYFLEIGFEFNQAKRA